jgi:hypothetical protein
MCTHTMVGPQNWSGTQDANRRQSRDQVPQGRHVRGPGQRARGQTSQATTRRDLMSQAAVTVAAHPRSSPDIVRFTVFCQARKHNGKARDGGPPGASILLRVYLPTAEASKKRRRWLKGRTSRGKILSLFGNGSSFRLTFSATTEQPFELAR